MPVCEWPERRPDVTVGFIVIMVILAVAVFCSAASAHDAHEATSPEQARVYEFYNGWMMPKGNYEGVEHRGRSCCNRQDCSRVLETRRRKDQRLEIRVCMENEVCDPDRWYVVNPSIIEENQPDPRESPDGAAHACIVGGDVRCYTGGGGT